MKQTIIIILAAIPFGLFAQEKKSFSLKEAQEHAVENSYQILMADIGIKEAKQDVNETTAIGLPQVSASAGFQNFLDVPTQVIPNFIAPAITQTLVGTGILPPSAAEEPADPEFIEAQFGTEFSTTVGITASQLIFDGRYFYGLKASKAYVNYAQLQKDRDEAGILEQVSQAYYACLVADESFEIFEKSIKNIQKTLSETEEMYKEGFMEELDIDQLKLMESNVSTQLENVKMQKENARALLKFMLAMPLDSEIELTDELESILSEDNAEAMILQNVSISKHRDMALIDEGINLQQLNLRATQSGYMPTLSAFFQHQQMNMANELDFQTWFPNTVWGVNLNVPIFTSFGTRSKVQKVKLGIDKLEVQKQQLSNSLQLEAMNAKSALVTSLSTYKNEKKNLELAMKIQRKTLEKFNLGMSSSLELTQAENQLLNTQGNYVRSIFDVLNAQTRLQNALGQ